MALTPVPQSTQTLAQTQAPILANFATIDADFSVNHVSYNNGGPSEGMHAVVNFVNQLAPVGPQPSTITAPQVNMTTVYASAPILGTGLSSLYIKAQGLALGVDGVEFTASYQSCSTLNGCNSTNGFTVLPSGIIMQWGMVTIDSTAGPGYTTIVFSGVVGCIAFPKNCFNVQLTPIKTAGRLAILQVLPATVTNVQFSAVANNYNNNAISTYAFFFAIGN